MTIGKTQAYILTFRYVNCGRLEAFANYPSEDLLTEDQIRARIYQVSCNSCGWNRRCVRAFGHSHFLHD